MGLIIGIGIIEAAVLIGLLMITDVIRNEDKFNEQQLRRNKNGKDKKGTK